jgi:hypothetical protein
MRGTENAGGEGRRGDVHVGGRMEEIEVDVRGDGGPLTTEERNRRGQCYGDGGG